MNTERSLKCSKRRLACAVTQCHAINFPFVMQGSHNPRNLRIWSCDQVESPNDRIYVLVRYRRRLDDAFNSWMRTSYHEDQSFGCLNCQRELTQLQCPGRLGHGSITDIPGAASVTPSIRTKLALGHGVPKVIICGGFPL